MTNVTPFKTKQQLRTEHHTVEADRWLAENAIRAQEHTVGCFEELMTEMVDERDRWTARVMHKEQLGKLEAMRNEYRVKYES